MDGTGAVRALGKCLDVPGSSTANGAQVQLWDCNGTGAQAWQTQPNGTLRNPPSGKCLDAAGFGTADGTRLQIWDCSGGSNQQWRTAMWANGARSGQITGTSGKCVDVRWSQTANSTPIQLYSCNGSNAQWWTLDGTGAVRAQGKCLDVPGSSTANGARTAAVGLQRHRCPDVADTDGRNPVEPQLEQVSGRYRLRHDGRHTAADLGLSRREQPGVAIALTRR